MKTKKPRVGIFSLTSCAGCQLTLLFSKEIMNLLEKCDIVNSPLLKSENEEGPFDIAIVEGSVMTREETEKIQRIRERSKVVVAIGACATYGGVPCIKDFGYEADILEEVCPVPTYLESVKVSGIGQYIHVDFYVRGCPPIKRELERLIKELLLEKKAPWQPTYPVCIECRMNENPCLLQQGKLCMGPVTFGGCNSLCLNLGIECYGCRGPLDDSNVDALVNLFIKKGFTLGELKRRFVTFAGTAKKFKEVDVLNE